MNAPILFAGAAEEVARLRLEIRKEALSWCETPFHDCAGLKGAGCDCVHLLQRVYQACGFALEFEMPQYPPQWFQHRDEPRFLLGLARYARRVERPLVGDVVMFNYGRHAAHSGIVIDADMMVHASSNVGIVTTDSISQYLGRLDSCWSVFA